MSEQRRALTVTRAEIDRPNGEIVIIEGDVDGKPAVAAAGLMPPQTREAPFPGTIAFVDQRVPGTQKIRRWLGYPHVLDLEERLIEEVPTKLIV